MVNAKWPFAGTNHRRERARTPKAEGSKEGDQAHKIPRHHCKVTPLRVLSALSCLQNCLLLPSARCMQATTTPPRGRHAAAMCPVPAAAREQSSYLPVHLVRPAPRVELNAVQRPLRLLGLDARGHQLVRCGAVRCGAVRCGAVWCGTMRGAGRGGAGRGGGVMEQQAGE
jgi:hypothetical protein